MNTLVAAVLAGAASAACARPDPRLSLEFSLDAGTTWFSDVFAMPGEHVLGQVVMSIPDSFYGISGARYNVVSTNVPGWDVGCDDTIDLTAGKGSATDGRVAGFDFGGQTQQVFEATNSLRIDAKGDNSNNANAGISTSQNTPGALGTLFNTAKTAPVFRFAVQIAAAHGWFNNITLRIADGGANGSPNQITSFTGYVSASASSGTPIDGVAGDTGTIWIFPAPGGALVLLPAGLALLGARRR